MTSTVTIPTECTEHILGSNKNSERLYFSTIIPPEAQKVLKVLLFYELGFLKTFDFAVNVNSPIKSLNPKLFENTFIKPSVIEYRHLNAQQNLKKKNRKWYTLNYSNEHDAHSQLRKFSLFSYPTYPNQLCNICPMAHNWFILYISKNRIVYSSMFVLSSRNN